ncbi:FixH family protein [Ancylobacter polymorphus]|uniref:FixH family protein n=1 Tax=Ancylobacter polymorphus TaxID=223390 RepID=A0A9E7CXK3_9HYPH|nr:FixH family protein [Ancylobacter polymorphus]UOK72444.1 FixH family protein [Ancylobacter polymorphus]
MSGPDTSPRPRRDLWIPAGFVLFFVALAGLQLWFVLLANRSFSGLVTDPKPAAGRYAAQAPDWTARLAFVPSEALAGTLAMEIAGANGAPLTPERLVATAERATRFPQLLPIVLHEVAPGRFEAPLRLPLAGDWAIRLTLTQAGATSERIETLEVAP